MIFFISLLLVTATSASALVVFSAVTKKGRLPLLWMLLAVAVWSGNVLELISKTYPPKSLGITCSIWE